MNSESKAELLNRLANMHGEYPRLKELYDFMDALRWRTSVGKSSPLHSLVVGEPGVGKTHAVRKYAEESKTHHDETDISEDHPIPVLYVQVPALITSRDLYLSIFQALGAPYIHSGRSVQDIRQQTIKLLQLRRVEMIILDEAHRILLSRQRPVEVVETLLELGTTANLSIVLVGPLEIAAFVHRDMRYVRRFSSFELDRIQQCDTEFSLFLCSLEQQIDSSRTSFSNPNTSLPALLHKFSGGLPGVAVSLIQLAYRKLLEDDALEQGDSSEFADAIMYAKKLILGDSDEGLGYR